MRSPRKRRGAFPWAIYAFFVFGFLRGTGAYLDCSDQQALYRSALSQLAPWFGGITEDHLAGAADYVRAKGLEAFAAERLDLPDFKEAPPALHRLKLDPSDLGFPWATSRYLKLTHTGGTWYALGGDIPVDDFNDGFFDACNRNFLYDLIKLAKTYALPDLTIIVKSGDTAGVYGPTSNGMIPPVFAMFSAEHAYDLVLPGCTNVANPMSMEEWLELMRESRTPWKEKLNKAVGRYDLICPLDDVYDRHRQKMQCPRVAIHKLTMSDLNKELQLLDAGVYVGAENNERDFSSHEQVNLARMDLVEQTKYKYSLNLDGLSAAGRLPFLLASDQLVILIYGSSTVQYFKDALQPWIHYVPSGRDDYSDIFSLIQWLNENSELAERIARAGQEFARRHFTERGRLCYTANLLQRYAKLQRFQPKQHLARSPRAKPLEEVLATFHNKTLQFIAARDALHRTKLD